jgi:hypothetical protein
VFLATISVYCKYSINSFFVRVSFSSMGSIVKSPACTSGPSEIESVSFLQVKLKVRG